MDNSITRDGELPFLEELLERAGAVLMDYFGRELKINHKQDRSIVTEADIAAEKVIISLIKSRYPKDLILAEESGLSRVEKNLENQAIWIIDPLDGTTNFANKYPCFCVSIARGVYLANNELKIVLGGIEAPVRRRRYLAEYGGGSCCNGKRIEVSRRHDIEDAFLVSGFANDRGERLARDIRGISAIGRHCRNLRRDGSAAIDMALVAEGVFDGFWEFGLNPWDIAAGVLLVREAGGVVMNYPAAQLKEASFKIDGPGLVCGNSAIAARISEILAELEY